MPASADTGQHRRGFFDNRRWYVVDVFSSRDEAVAAARNYRRTNAHGKGRAYRVTHSTAPGSDKWVVQHAAAITDNDRRHGAHYNKRMIEDDDKQRRLGF